RSLPDPGVLPARVQGRPDRRRVPRRRLVSRLHAREPRAHPPGAPDRRAAGRGARLRAQPAPAPGGAGAARARPAASGVLLRGREATALGAVAEAGADEVGAAITRGGAPKPYDHVDPNEDAALAMGGRRGVLVAVADGHWGHVGAERALEALREIAEDW